MPKGKTRRGGAVAIIYDILSALKESSLQTRIMQRANLSWSAYTQYRNALIQNDLVAAILLDSAKTGVAGGGNVEILLTRKGLELERMLEQVFDKMKPVLETLYDPDGSERRKRESGEYVPAEERPGFELLKVRAKTRELANKSNNSGGFQY